MKKELKLEEAMTRLTEIVSVLENGDKDLDDSLQLYEEGVSLIKFCSGQLDRAEQKVKLLKVNADGSVEEQPFLEKQTEHDNG